MGEGRFGPLYRAHAADGGAVVVRTFVQPLTEDQRERFTAQLDALCERPLDHPSIARPMASGIQDHRPFLVHAYLPGTPLSDVVGRPVMAGSRRLGPVDLALRLTYLAGALDFAAAVGVFHGALTAADVIFSEDNAGVSGLGLVQALEAAGVDGFHARREDDVLALVAIARQLLGERATPAVRAVLNAPPPPTALEFAASLQQALEDLPIAPTFDFESESVAVDAQPFDMPLRDEPYPAEHEPAFDPLPEPTEPAPVMTMDAAPAMPADSAPMMRAEPPPLMAAPMFGATAEDVMAATPTRRRGGRGWLLTAAIGLALGIFAGFAGGFLVARDTPLAPAPVTTAPPSQPEATNGQPFTDAPVDVAPQVDGTRQSAEPPAPVEATPAPARAAPATPPPPRASSATRAAVPPSPARPSGPAAMRVDSLPAGAQVFVDGRSVGYTPMVVGDLVPGTHSIRLQLPGYRPWVNAVTLGPGARERVSASLEQ